jgi:hypothetical protein
MLDSDRPISNGPKPVEIPDGRPIRESRHTEEDGGGAFSFVFYDKSSGKDGGNKKKKDFSPGPTVNIELSEDVLKASESGSKENNSKISAQSELETPSRDDDDSQSPPGGHINITV